MKNWCNQGKNGSKRQNVIQCLPLIFHVSSYYLFLLLNSPCGWGLRSVEPKEKLCSQMLTLQRKSSKHELEVYTCWLFSFTFRLCHFSHTKKACLCVEYVFGSLLLLIDEVQYSHDIIVITYHGELKFDK